LNFSFKFNLRRYITARVGVRDAMKMMMGRLPKLWKKLGVDPEMALQRLALAVTHPIDVKLNVDAEVGTHCYPRLTPG
jgi:hypothetical protein